MLPGLTRRRADYERRRREEGCSEEQTFEYLEEELGRFAIRATCPGCAGARLRPEALAIRLGRYSIHELCERSIRELRLARLVHGLSSQKKRYVYFAKAKKAFMLPIGFQP